MPDNLTFATETMRTTVTNLKKKVSNIQITVEQFRAELDKMESKFDKLLVQAEIYRSRVEREAKRDVRKLELELEKARKQTSASSFAELPDIPESEFKIASTVAVFECILRHMCEGADDFKLMCHSIIFPSIYERIIQEEKELYLETVPKSADIVINRGKQFLYHLRGEFETHLTEPSAWESCIEAVTEWWKNDAFPLLYGERYYEWDTDMGLPLIEILQWKEEPADRPLQFPSVFDVFELYKKHKDEVFEKSGVRAFDLKMFRYSESDTNN